MHFGQFSWVGAKLVGKRAEFNCVRGVKCVFIMFTHVLNMTFSYGNKRIIYTEREILFFFAFACFYINKYIKVVKK